MQECAALECCLFALVKCCECVLMLWVFVQWVCAVGVCCQCAVGMCCRRDLWSYALEGCFRMCCVDVLWVGVRCRCVLWVWSLSVFWVSTAWPSQDWFLHYIHQVPACNLKYMATLLDSKPNLLLQYHCEIYIHNHMHLNLISLQKNPQNSMKSMNFS